MTAGYTSLLTLICCSSNRWVCIVNQVIAFHISKEYGMQTRLTRYLGDHSMSASIWIYTPSTVSKTLVEIKRDKVLLFCEWLQQPFHSQTKVMHYLLYGPSILWCYRHVQKCTDLSYFGFKYFEVLNNMSWCTYNLLTMFLLIELKRGKNN